MESSYQIVGRIAIELMKEIRAVNACRRDAIAKGMKLEEAMAEWTTIDQVPDEYKHS